MDAKAFKTVSSEPEEIWVVRAAVVAFARNRYGGTDLYLNGGHHICVSDAFNKVQAWILKDNQK